MPKAYIISDVSFKNEDVARAYRELAAPSIEHHGGRYVVRGGEVSVLEGEWRPRMLVIAEFPGRDAAERWYRSAEYGKALAYRDAELERNLIMVNGVP